MSAKLSTMVAWLGVILMLGLSPGCNRGSDDDTQPITDPAEPSDSSNPSDPIPPAGDVCQNTSNAELMAGHVWVCVTLDDGPASGALVMQGGDRQTSLADDTGLAMVPVEGLGEALITVVASHPDARIKSTTVSPSYAGEVLNISLTRFSRVDNSRYTFQDPGAPRDSPTTAQCGHCHVSQNKDWYASAHRTSASSPWVQQLYAGTSDAKNTEESCVAAGGRWLVGLIPGTNETAPRCYLGHGTLPALNTDCGVTNSCDTVATAFGACADCHAPGINGDLGGRNLLDAKGIEFEDGVHCDTCHRVESVNLDATQPGVAGKLQLVRPSEGSPSPGLGEYLPLTFGPRHDVPNPRMGSVQRDHYSNGELCSGCHEYEQPSLVPGTSVDSQRWPDGRLPVHSTWSEWLQGPLGPEVSCLQCHMPPDATAMNSSNFENLETASENVTYGFIRTPGSVRKHQWVGPRTEGSRMLDLAAAVQVQKQVNDGVLDVAVKVKHVGPGHALPTGEPMRSMVLTVEATCEGELQAPMGGDVVPDFGGYEEVRAFDFASDPWPDAQVGDLIRVVRRPGTYYNYRGFGPFGDGRFNALEKGMPVEQWVGEVAVTAVSGSGLLTLSGQLPDGDIVYRVRDTGGDTAGQVAGTPGFGFARVMVGADGERMVPHFLAVDIASDNRLLPFDAWTSNHQFTVDCEQPIVNAVLRYRPIAFNVAKAKSAPWYEKVMQEVRR